MNTSVENVTESPTHFPSFVEIETSQRERYTAVLLMMLLLTALLVVASYLRRQRLVRENMHVTFDEQGVIHEMHEEDTGIESIIDDGTDTERGIRHKD